MREEPIGIPEDSEKIPVSSAAAHQVDDGCARHRRDSIVAAGCFWQAKVWVTVWTRMGSVWQGRLIESKALSILLAA
jgi:hypothetical protein